MSITITVKVKPNARHSSLVQLSDGTWLACTKAPAREGKANVELVNLVAEEFRCAKGAVAIRSGVTGRVKRLAIG